MLKASLAALERELIITKSVIYVSETSKQTYQQKQQENDYMALQRLLLTI